MPRKNDIKYTDEYLIKVIKEKAEELGRIPKRREVTIVSHIVFRKRFGSWNNAVEKAGLEAMRQKHFNKEECLDIIKKYINEFDEVPLRSNFDAAREYPHSDTILNILNFKSWTKLMESLGYETAISKAEIKEERSIVLNKFKEEYIRLNPSSLGDFDKRRSGYSSGQYIRFFNLKWNELLNICGFKINQIYARDEKEIIKRFKKLSNKLDRTPSISECTEAGISLYIIRYKYKNYSSFLKEMNYKQTFNTPIIVDISDEELLKLYSDFSDKMGKADIGASAKDLNEGDVYNSDVFTIRFGGMIELKKLAGKTLTVSRNKKYTKDTIVELLFKEYKLKNRILTNKEISNNDMLPGLTTILRYFNKTKMSLVWDEIINKNPC